MGLRILLLFVAVSQVWSQCHIPSNVVRNFNHTFAVQPAKNRPLRLLFSNVIDNGAVLNLICDRRTTKITCKDNTFQRSLDGVAPCGEYTKTVLIKNRRDPQFNCIIYDMTLPYYASQSKKQYLLVYRSCYDVNKKTPVYTNHWAYTAEARHTRPNVNFKAETPAPTDANIRLTPTKLYDVFQELYGNNQLYHQKGRMLINRGHLVPSGAFAYCSPQVATFNFINVVPQFRAINSGNWLRIEDYVRDNLARPSGAKVTTGAFGVLELKNNARNKMVPLFIRNKREMPTPKWTYQKIQGHNTVYLVYNSLFDVDKVPKPKCGATPCREFQLMPAEEGGLTFCCNAQEFERWFQNENRQISG